MFLNKTQIQDYVLNNYGLFIDHRSLYHDMYRPYFSTNSGLWQQPTEITDLIYFLQDKNIKTFLNIGTFNGETIDCITNLLPSLTTVISIDPIIHNIIHRHEKCLYIQTTSAYFKNIIFDAVFIDGNHSYENSKEDFVNVGKFAKYCIFHDIKDKEIEWAYNGGCVKFWKDIKDLYQTIEFLAEDKPCETMGIGVVIN